MATIGLSPRVSLLSFLLLHLIFLPPAHAVIMACAGDCDANGEVTVNEIVTLVAIALGNATGASCRNGERDDDGAVTVDEIVAAIGSALRGCSLPSRAAAFAAQKYRTQGPTQIRSLADVNGDGLLDINVSVFDFWQSSPSVVLLGRPGGRFDQQPVDRVYQATGDVNDDGTVDALVIDGGSLGLVLDVASEEPVRFDLGIPDVVHTTLLPATATIRARILAVRRNLAIDVMQAGPSGEFGMIAQAPPPMQQWDGSHSARWIVADIDNDGAIDVAAVAPSWSQASAAGSVLIAWGTSSGGFDAFSEYLAGSVTDIAVGDVDGDRRNELISLSCSQRLEFAPAPWECATTALVSVVDASNRTAATTESFAADPQSVRISAPDLDGNGVAEVVVLSSSGYGFGGYIGYGELIIHERSGTAFRRRTSIFTSARHPELETADLDGDARDDLVTAGSNEGYGTGDVTVIYGRDVSARERMSARTWTDTLGPSAAGIRLESASGVHSFAVASGELYAQARRVVVLRPQGETVAEEFPEPPDYAQRFLAVDANHDGHDDLFSVFTTLKAWVSRQDGQFGPAIEAPVATAADQRTYHLADVDGDGSLDAIYTDNSVAPSIFVDTTPFDANVTPDAQNEVSEKFFQPKLVGCDVDGDGVAEIVAVYLTDVVDRLRYSAIEVFEFSNGLIRSTHRANFRGQPGLTLCRDVDNDGSDEVLSIRVLGQPFDQVRRQDFLQVWSLASDGLRRRFDIETGANAVDIDIADIDGSGPLDIAIANSGACDVTLALRSADGGLNVEHVATPCGALATGLRDVDGDGLIDIELLVSASFPNVRAGTTTVFGIKRTQLPRLASRQAPTAP